ncbi:FKBP-type peptidyl-prolyl cis-trans isomerase [Almyronema epifaneia]|uniref:Peptidyl-prolyl cis-trans isomerase n=1 Tax=Almyronema epifaneia S1 TaxID=2991925 RepID=A0ABW6IKH8_9CYAN
MTQAKTGDTVVVHYTGKLQDGTVFDSSVDRQPFQFSIGGGEVIPGFEQAVVGMAPGEAKTEVIPCDQAYGPHRSEIVFEVQRQQLPAEAEVSIGQQFQLQHPSGQMIPVMVTEVEGSKVVLDANHPLAGEELTFEIQLVDIAS